MSGKELIIKEYCQVGSAAQADNDHQLLAMWLHGRPQTTMRAYAYEVKGMLSAVDKPLQRITLRDLQGYFGTLVGLSPASQARNVNAVKSLFSFALRIGFLAFNPAAAIRSPKIKRILAERILPEPQVHRLLALEPNSRNRVLLRLLYASGVRVSEICSLKWRDVQPRGEAGQITIFGKGGKTRSVLLSTDTWRELIGIRNDADSDIPVFSSRKGGGHLHPSQAWRIVRAAAERCGVDMPVSPHWLRHAHASHALDRGCPIHLLQATLGHASVATTGKYLHARPDDSSSRYLGV
jgi:site-specific recombinase XerD